MKKLPLPKALAWIVGSTFVVTCGTYMGTHLYYKWKSTPHVKQPEYITTIIQTSPQKGALDSDYLAELLDLSIDKPKSNINLEEAKALILSSPVIKEVSLRMRGKNTLYIDYTLRKPIARLYDLENTFLDSQGNRFPIVPFFTPKNLPEIILGGCEDSFPLAYELLNLVPFEVKSIDLTNLAQESLGRREIILETNDHHILRLPHHGYEQSLGNYLELRPSLHDPCVVDLRIPKLAFVESL